MVPDTFFFFHYRFEAKSADNSYTDVVVRFFARQFSTFVGATTVPISDPDLSSSWQVYEGVATFDQAWDEVGSDLRFGPSFDMPGATGVQATRRGELDEVTLLQAPEPATLGLFGLGVLAMLWTRRRAGGHTWASLFRPL